MAAAAVVSVSMGVMKPVLAKLATLMGDEYKKLKGLQKEVTFLRRELTDMDALLENMDSAEELDPQRKKWRKDIIEMSYNIEDRIDDFMQSVGEVDDDKMGILRKASHYVKTFKDRRRLANEFQEIKTLVTEASDRRKRYMLDNQCISVTIPVVVDPRLSALYQKSASLVGIEAQKDELVNWTVDEVKELKFMAIVGFGGVGKTTLANEVYREVGSKFECKAFISVSQKPQMIGLFNSLLLQLGQPTYSHAWQLQDPINALRGHLQDKKYFNVIDDLWDTQAWDVIECAFPESDHHSRVIITTRNENVARSCCSNHGCIYNMKHLSEKDSRQLFFGRIFGSEDACPTELNKTSCQILRRCGGLPLAIITMASMLACQPRLEEQWEHIQNSLDIKSATNSKYEDMIYILDLSYKNLPRHLKACFLYLGSYPEDHEIERVELVRRWVAEGFVSNSAGQDVWDVAESYFNELVNRSMIQPTYNEYFAEVSSCRVHDMLLDLILRRCKEDNFLHLVNDPPAEAGSEVKDDEVIRRLTIVGLIDTEDDAKVPTTIVQNLSQIRSLSIRGKSNWTPLLLEFRFLRVLLLRDCHDGINIDMTCINHLPQLRYLSVSRANVTLPCQIHGLRFLETLELYSRTTSSNALEIVDVPRLSHLVIPWDIRLPDGNIGKLKSLHTLHNFIVVPTNSLESIIGMGQLTALSDLSLILPSKRCMEKQAECMEALSASLGKLSNLRKLCMSGCGNVARCVDALSSLSPPFHNLEQLDIDWCTFSRVPRWIGHLHSLRDLSLGVKQMVQDDFAIIGTGAPSLLSLKIRISGVLTERITARGSMGFASVKYFVFNCDCVSCLVFEAGAMPELRHLILAIDVYDWDKAAPGGLQHLRSLKDVEAQMSCYYSDEWRGRRDCASNAEEELIKGVFQEAVEALPTGPAFIFRDAQGLYRPREEEEEEEEECLKVVD